MNILISIIIPIYSRYEHLGKKLNSLNSHLISKCLNHEIILVDNTNALPLNNFSNRGEYISVLKSDVTSSQQSAYMKGFEVSKGDWVLLLDYDLVDKLELIDTLISNMDERYDVIRSIRRNRRHQHYLRFLGSMTANFIFNLFNKNKIRDIGSSLSLYKKEYYRSALDKKYEKFNGFPLFILILKPAVIKEVFIDSSKEGIDSEYSLIKLLLLFLRMVMLKFKMTLSEIIA